MDVLLRSRFALLLPCLLAACGGGRGNLGDGGNPGSDAGSAGYTQLATSQANPTALVVDATNVYWTNTDSTNGAVVKVPIVGGSPVTLASGGYPYAVAVDSTTVYFADQGDRSVSGSGGGGSIKAVPIAGGSVTTLASNQPLPTGVLVDANSVYWVTEPVGLGVQAVPRTGGTIRNLGGCDTNLFNPGCDISPGGMAQDASHIYYASGGRIWVVNKAGGTMATSIEPADDGTPDQVVLVGTKLYWSSAGQIEVGNASGGGVQILVSGLNGSWGVAVDASNIYFGVQNGSTHIGRVPLSGGMDNHWQDGNGSDSPNNITLDAAHVYWTGSDGVNGTVYKAAK